MGWISVVVNAPACDTNVEPDFAVLLLIDESGDNTGATLVRLINVSTSGFQIYANGDMDGLAWIAFEPGDYTHGNLHWRAGSITTPGTCLDPCVFAVDPALPVTPGVLMTLYDTNNAGALWVRTSGVSTTELQYTMDSASTEIVDYVAFWRDE